MRRKEREITDVNELLSVVKDCNICRVAFYDEEGPYIVPMNFGYDFVDNKLVLYFHCGLEGKKLDLLRSNSKVGFEMDTNHRLVGGNMSCDYTMKFESILGKGIISVVEDDKKIQGLTCLMKQFEGAPTDKFEQKYVDIIRVLKLEVTEWTGKRNC